MKYIYKINEGVSGSGFHADIEADHYNHSEGYFDFYQGFGSSREKVESVRDGIVSRITRTEKK
ncbi:hypothetical protein [Curtobacterium aurantiacum]|uniref:hypothetical protein n=1 Tax=Curtobacterium aurantiacum TaxID=3236919 RepID=UPI001BE00F20|nr:hypothetical protein [Curtobacterium flaccumfaciens]MBT1676796.1 hypothetical protein [Curtobacterium flaccumfaciens pv. flaccumfaciens]